MGALWIPDAADWLRAAGLEVVEYDGWLTRSRQSGGFDDILAIGCHHSASAIGRSDQRAADAHWRDHPVRPVGNFTLGRSGTWWVGAAGASNTQGVGGPFVGSRGTIPANRGNANTIAIEAENNGVGEPWSDDMQDSYVLGVAALLAGLAADGAYDANRRRHVPIVLDSLVDVIAHFEWTSRKIDPAGPSRWANTADRYQRWQMPAFRSDIAADLAALNAKDSDMNLFPAPPRVFDATLTPADRRAITLPFGDKFTQVQMSVQVIPLDGPDPDTTTDPGFIRFIPPSAAGTATHSDLGWAPGTGFAQTLVECLVENSQVVIETGPAACRVICDMKGYVAGVRP